MVLISKSGAPMFMDGATFIQGLRSHIQGRLSLLEQVSLGTLFKDTLICFLGDPKFSQVTQKD